MIVSLLLVVLLTVLVETSVYAQGRPFIKFARVPGMAIRVKYNPLRLTVTVANVVPVPLWGVTVTFCYSKFGLNVGPGAWTKIGTVTVNMPTVAAAINGVPAGVTWQSPPPEKYVCVMVVLNPYGYCPHCRKTYAPPLQKCPTHGVQLDTCVPHPLFSTMTAWNNIYTVPCASLCEPTVIPIENFGPDPVDVGLEVDIDCGIFFEAWLEELKKPCCGWQAWLSEYEVHLKPGEKKEVTLNIQAPDDLELARQWCPYAEAVVTALDAEGRRVNEFVVQAYISEEEEERDPLMECVELLAKNTRKEYKDEGSYTRYKLQYRYKKCDFFLNELEIYKDSPYVSARYRSCARNLLQADWEKYCKAFWDIVFSK
jgi:hypothetical protein